MKLVPVRCHSVSDCVYCSCPRRLGIGESRKSPTVDILFYDQASKYIAFVRDYKTSIDMAMKIEYMDQPLE